MEIVKGVARLFYFISPNETAVPRIEDIPHPDYVTAAVPYFLTFIVLEYLIQLYQDKRRARLNDAITSLSHGIYLGCQEMVFRGVENYFYIKVYENWRIYELPWDSPLTWYIAAIAVDFGYYWVHRAAHEVHIFWAKHQVHHSSEDYNLTTALRQSAVQHWLAFPFYLPMALFVPPSIYLIHHQFNLLYQFWIHTELVDNIGPLEYILNTPKHHRIHHGSNRYCLDKNYAGVLIIWDRMFGTFAEEKPGENIVYGLVEDVKSFNPFYLQTFYYPKIWNRMKEYDNWSDKLSVMLKGPGWTPGKPRLGDINDVPEIPTRQKFHVELHKWKNIYVSVHFLVLVAAFDYFSKHFLTFSQFSVLSSVAYILFTLTSIGYLLEDRKIGAITEISRSMVIILYLLVSGSVGHPVLSQLLYGLFGGSIGLWSIYLTLAKEASKPHKNLANGKLLNQQQLNNNGVKKHK